VITSGGSRLRPRSARQALTLTLLLGAIGAGIAFLATRQGWADVRTAPPRPLPAGKVTITGASMVPYADALVLAGLASLVAVLATKRVLRRVSGLLVAGLGAGLAASAFTVSPAGAVAAAAASIGPASNPGAGSVTQGSGSASSPVPDLVGATPHVDMLAAGWQALVVIGGLAMIAAGIIALCKPAGLAVMGGKYEAPADPDEARRRAERSRQGGQDSADSASIWDALSRGDDPTAGGRRTAAGA
jgi:uncharacterized membrane protein (TIGR02234 family)